jgi:hypothetical protein
VALALFVTWKSDPGQDDKSCARSYGVNMRTLVAVFSDEWVGGEVLRAAEGQMVRCFAKAKGRNSKMMFFECWMECLRRLIDSEKMAIVTEKYNVELSEVRREWELVRSSVVVGQGVAAHKEALEVVDGSVQRMAYIMNEGRKNVPGVRFDALLVEKCWRVEKHIGKFGLSCLQDMAREGVCGHE